MKNHRDFVVYVRGGIAINALVAVSRDVVTPATQTEPAKAVEHLTLVYLSPDSARPIMSGDQLRNSVKFEFDVPPLVDGGVNGWKDVIAEVTAPSDIAQGSGSEKYGASDWTAAGEDATGFPVPKGSPEDVTTAPTSSPKDAPLTNPLPTESEAIAAAQVADAVVLDDKVVSGPDGLTDAQRGYKWGSDEHKRQIAGLPQIAEGIPDSEIVQNDPALTAALAGLPTEDTHADEIADAENNHGVVEP